MKAALYVRVSTDEQAKEGFSIDAQLEKLEAYAKAKGWRIYDRYVWTTATLAGRSTGRPTGR